MRFSIVIPVFKTERFLPRCLDSLVAQTDGDFEVLVIDDNSPGPRSKNDVDCFGIVARYDDRFHCIRHEVNRSAFQTRCTGVKAAKGNYIVPVDPDDYLLPETLAKLREVIERENSDMISYRMAYDNGKKVWDHWCHHPSMTMTGVEALRELIEHKYFTGVASKALRRETLLAALHDLNASEDFYANTCDDFLMLVPMLMKSEKVSFLDFVGYRYFVNEQSTSYSWKTRAGFRQASEQMHMVNLLIEQMAKRDIAHPEVQLLVSAATNDIALWFAQMEKDSSWVNRMVRRTLRFFSSK